MVSQIDVPDNHATVLVPGALDLRQRIAAAVVKMAPRFNSDILLNAGTLHVDAKSTQMALLLLNALKGQMLEIVARGPDSPLAIQNLSALFG